MTFCSIVSSSVSQTSHEEIEITSSKIQLAQALVFKEKERQAELAFEKRAYESRVRQYALLTGAGLLLFVELNHSGNNRNKQR